MRYAAETGSLRGNDGRHRCHHFLGGDPFHHDKRSEEDYFFARPRGPDFNRHDYVELGTEVRAFVEFAKGRWDEVHKHSIHEGMKMRLLQAVYVMIALILSSVCGAAQELPSDESAPLV